MDDSENLYKLFQRVAEHKTLLLRSVIVLIIFAAVVDFFVHNALVYVDAQAAFPLQGVTVYASSDAPKQKTGGVGLNIVPRNTKSLIVTMGNFIRTQTKIDLPWYGFASKKVILQKELNADKVPYMSTVAAACATYAPTSNQLAYYSCNHPITLTRYAQSGNSMANEMISKLNFSVTPPQPFMGGVMGISYFTNTDNIPDGDIVLVTATGNTVRYDDPPDINRDSINSAQLFTDTADPTNSHFAVAMRNGDVFIGTVNPGGGVHYDRIVAPHDYNVDYNQTLCTLSDTLAYCYRGPTAFGDAPTNFDYSKVTHSQIVTFALANGTTNNSLISDNLFFQQGLYVTATGELYTKSFFQLYHLAKSGGGLRADSISQNIYDVGAGDKMYYIQDNGVFAADASDPTTNYQVFYSPNIIPKAIYPVAGKVFIIGTSKTDDSITYAYLLNQSVDVTPGKRLIDQIPFVDSSMSDTVYSSDLIGDKIYITIRMSVRGLDSEDFNVELAQKKEEVLNYLATIGLQVDESQIVFSTT